MEAEVLSVIEEDSRWRSVNRIRADYEGRYQAGSLAFEQRKRFYRVLESLEASGVIVKQLSVNMTQAPLSDFATPESELQADGRPFGLFYRSRMANAILSEVEEEPAIAAE